MAKGNLFEHVANRTVANASIIDRAKDLGIDAIKAAVGLPESIVGLADIPTGGAVGKWIEENTPVQFEETQNILNDYYSDERKQEQQDVSKAFDESFLGGMGEALSQPAVPIGTIIQSLPQMLGGRAIAGGAMKVMPKLSQAFAAGMGEGVFSAGSTAEGIRYENESRDLTVGQSLTALGSGTLTGVLGGVSNKIGAKFGLEDIDVASKVTKETIKTNSKKSLVKAILGGFFTEGVLEELPQSIQEQIAMNLATGKEWDEGLAEAAGMGIISGGLMGSAINAKTNISAKLAMVKLRAMEQLKGELDEHDKQEVVDGNQEKSLTKGAIAPEEAIATQENEAIVDDVDGAIPFGEGEEEDYSDIPDYDELEDYDQESDSGGTDGIIGARKTGDERRDVSDLDFFIPAAKDDFSAEDTVIEPFIPEGYDPKRGINSDDIKSIEGVETASHPPLDAAIEAGTTKAIKENGVYLVRGNQTKSIAANVNGAIAVNIDKAQEFFHTQNKNLLGENTSAVLDSFGITAKEFKNLFTSFGMFKKFLISHEKAHTFYGDKVTSQDAERRATYSVLSKSQKKKLIALIEKNIKETHHQLNKALTHHNAAQGTKSAQAYQEHYQKLEMLLEQLTNIYEAEKIPANKRAKYTTEAMLRRLATETAQSHMNRILKHTPEARKYKKSGEVVTDEVKHAQRKYLLPADMSEDAQLGYYKQQYEDIVKSDRSNSSYVAPIDDTRETFKEADHEKANPQKDLDNGVSVRAKTKRSVQDIIDNAPESELGNIVDINNLSKRIRSTEESPLVVAENKRELKKAVKELAKNKELSITNGEKIPHTDYDVSLAGFILEMLEMLGDSYSIKDMIEFIKEKEGKMLGYKISSLSQLDGYPESLEDLVSGLAQLVDYEKQMQENGETVEDLPNDFQEEHDKSLKYIEDAIQDHDAVDTEFEGDTKTTKVNILRKKNKAVILGKKNTPKIKTKVEVINGKKKIVFNRSKPVKVEKKVKDKDKKFDSLGNEIKQYEDKVERTDVTISEQGETVSVTPVKEKLVNINKEHAEAKKGEKLPTKKENVKNAAKEKKVKEREAITKRKNSKDKLAAKEQERKQKLLKHVEQEIEDNQLIGGMIPGFFKFIDELKGKGKFKAAATFDIKKVGTFLRKEYKGFAGLYRSDPLKADQIVRKLIYTINSLHDTTFKAFDNKQQPNLADETTSTIVKSKQVLDANTGRIWKVSEEIQRLNANDLEDEDNNGNKRLKKLMQDEVKDALGSVTAEDTNMLRQEVTQLGGDPELFLLDSFEERVSNTDLINRTGRNIFTVIMNVDGKAKLLNGVTFKELQILKETDPNLFEVGYENPSTQHEGVEKGRSTEHRRSAKSSPNGYEVSKGGDKRFDPDTATLSNGKTITESFTRSTTQDSSAVQNRQTTEKGTSGRAEDKGFENVNKNAEEELINAASEILDRIEDGEAHFSTGDPISKHILKSFISGEDLTYSVGDKKYTTQISKAVVEYTIEVYKNNFEMFAKGLPHSEARKSIIHTDNVGAVFSKITKLAEKMRRKIKFNIPSAKDGVLFNGGEFTWAHNRKVGEEYGNFDLCSSCSARTSRQLLYSGLPSAVFSMGQIDTTTDSGRLGDHKSAITEINGKRYLVDVPQKELWKPLKKQKSGIGEITNTEFNPRFIEATPENITKFYGLTKESSIETSEEINRTELDFIKDSQEEIVADAIRRDKREVGIDLSSIVSKNNKNKLSFKEQYEQYKALWSQFLDENPDLYSDLVEKTKNKTLTDKFAIGPINQARALAELITERSNTFGEKTEENARGRKLIEIQLFDAVRKNWGEKQWVTSFLLFDFKNRKEKFKLTGKTRILPLAPKGSKLVEVKVFEERTKSWSDPIWVPNSEFLEMQRSKKVKYQETGETKILPSDATVLGKWDNDNTVNDILESLGKTLEDYDDKLVDAFIDYAQKAFKNDVLANPELFDNLIQVYGKYTVDKNGKNGVTKADLANVYVNTGSKEAVLTYISTKMQEHFNKVADKLGAQWTQEGSKGVISEYMTMRMDENQLKEYEDYKNNKTDNLYPEQIAFYKATLYVENQLNTIKVSQAKAAKEAKEDAEKNKIHTGFPESISEIKAAVGLNPNIEDVFIPNEAQDESKPYVAGTLVDKVSQHLYEKLAKAFGAELLIVSHDPSKGKKYKSRYLPEGANGKPQLVINIAEPVKFSSIFAHELFHHIVNKSNKAEYKAFTNALSKLGATRNKESDYGKNYKKEAEAKILIKLASIKNKNSNEYIKFNNELTKIREQRAYVSAWGLQDNNRRYDAQLLLKNEEIQAELFADIIYDKGFYETLSKSLAGKGLAARLISRLIKLIGKVHDFFHGKKREWAYDFDARINKEDMQKAYALVADLIGHSINNEALQHTEDRYHTPLGNTSKEELNKLSENSSNWFKGVWAKVFPYGTKNRKDAMNGIQELISKTIKWIADAKPKGMIADFMVDKTVAYYAMLIQNQPNYEKSIAKKRIVNPNKEVFNDYTTGVVLKTKLQMARGEYRTKNGKLLDPKDPKDVATMRELLKDLPKLTMEQLYDDFARNGIDVSTEQGVSEALRRGYTHEVVDVFIQYQEMANDLYKQLKEFIPSLKENKTHYGLSMKWYSLGTKIYNAFDSVVTDEFDQFERSKQLGGPEQFLKARNQNMTTDEIAKKYDIQYKTIDPHEMFLEYVEDAKRLINLRKMIIEGTKTGHVKIFRSEKEANEKGMLPINDDSSSIVLDLATKEGYQLVDEEGNVLKINGKPSMFTTEQEANDAATQFMERKDTKVTVEAVDSPTPTKVAYYVVNGISNVIEQEEEEEGVDLEPIYDRELARFQSKDEATQYAKGKDVKIEPVFAHAKETEVARYYFDPKLQNMLNITLKQDGFRKGKFFGISGNQLLNVKNMMTSVQFAFSMFHFVTITQELMSSYATWAQMKKHKNIFSRFNVVTAWNESKELAVLFEEILINKDYATDPAIVKRISELLGVNGLDVADMMNAYFHAGGLIDTDESLENTISGLAKQKYTKGKDRVTIENGNVTVDYAPFSMGAVKDSIKEAYNNALLENPNSKLTAAGKASLFASLETTTAWLMKHYIPKVKMAMWAREYTMNLERQAEGIANGKTTKEEIGRQSMKWIEDRFGEVNWKNMWLDPSLKSMLQFFFRSFTWRAGTWKALAKTNIDYGKWVWFKAKGEKYELTEQGIWGFNAMAAHFLTVGLVAASYQLVVLGAGGEVPDDEETPLLTKVLFPRNDRSDPFSRVGIPSYITEFYKIFMHMGALGGDAEPEKIVSGGLNSLLVNTWEALITGEDWRGVSIRNEDENVALQMMDTIIHILGVLPISFSTIKSNYKMKGFDFSSSVFATFGMTSAPAAAKRSVATNAAFSKRRTEFKGRSVTEDEMKLKDNVKRAAYMYGRGNKEPLLNMLRDGRISRQKFKNALKRIPHIDGKVNPHYQTPLYVALNGLTIGSALDIWDKMSDKEKKEHRSQLIKKYNNVKSRKDKSMKQKLEIRKEMQQLGIFN